MGKKENSSKSIEMNDNFVKFGLLTFYGILQYLDYKTTKEALEKNYGKEANPCMKFVINKFGFKGFGIVKALVFGTTALTLNYQSRNSLIGVNLVQGAVVANNYIVKMKYDKRGFHG